MVKKQFTEILRSLMSEQAPENPEAWDAEALCSVAAQQNCLPVLAYVNKRWNLFSDEAVNRRLEAILYATIAGNLNRCVAFEMLSEKLTEHEIEHMPVKGYWLRDLYPVPELRTFGDVDILIHPADRQKTHRLMCALGYAVKQDWEPSYSYSKDMEYYELHTRLMDGNLDDRADLQAYFDDAWSAAVPQKGLCHAPEPAFHFLYIICHLAKHLYSGGAGMRMYLDIAFFVRHYDGEMDWVWIERQLSGLSLTALFHTVMNACRVWFGMETVCPLPEPDIATLDALRDYTLEADLFGHTRDRSAVELRNAEQPLKWKWALKTMFPPAEEIEARYTFLKGRHWLLPAAWVVRLLKNRKRLPEQMGRFRRVSGVSDSRVEAYDRFMKSIGL